MALKLNLIEDCRHWWKMWSVWLAAAAGVIATVLSSSPGILTWLVNEYLPAGPLRYVATGSIGLFVFVIPTIVRLLPQTKLKEQNDGTR